MSSTISKREAQILELISYDYSTIEIATDLFISYHTVVSHKKNIRSKLKVNSTAAMVRKGFEIGILHI